MEEILASIRRIIADDQVLPLSRPASPSTQAPEGAAPAPTSTGPARPPVASAPASEAAPASQLRPTPRQEAYETPQFEREIPRVEAPRARVEPVQRSAPPAQPAPVAREPAPQPAPRPVERREPVRVEPAPVVEKKTVAIAEECASLLSATADASISSSFNALATTVLLQNSGMIEDSIREMLRPLLKQWLDDNLPVIVERLVRQEIERVARGRR